ncbi:MAG: phosphoribosylformylglycinamidine synthase subunit PurL [candidate division WOR-3 bacterium]
MLWRIEVGKTGTDPEGRALQADICDLGIRSQVVCRVVRLYYLEGELDRAAVERVASELLADPVAERYCVVESDAGRAHRPARTEETSGRWYVEVLYNPGVMDPSVESTIRALADMGIHHCRLRTGRAYEFTAAGSARLSAGELNLITRSLLVNPVIQHVARPDEPVFVKAGTYRYRRSSVRLRDLTPPELEALSRDGLLALSRAEMLALQRYYRKLGREPTDVELETFAQTWSEHCQHKTFRGEIDLDGRRIRNLLKSTIMRCTKELNRPWCLSVFHDNSGVIEFDKTWGISFKVETHNHPSALEPYGGAATGIGGVIRDCLGTGLGAKPILNTDVFCFAPIDTRPDDVPRGVLHPRRIMKGVVAGVRDYGNRMGIPTANGAVYFDTGFLGNPLVFCGTLGLIPRNKLKKQVRPGQAIILLGGRTGRDGIHGVTFASLELGRGPEAMSGGAVQIGNPIEEKKVLDLVLAARDKGLFEAITDCGGGGLSSAIGELARPTGAVVWLERVPLKYSGLSPAEIWISEAQERMVVFSPQAKARQLQKLAQDHDVEATVIGRVTSDHRLTLKYRGHLVGQIDMNFLHRGWKGVKKVARWRRPETADPTVPVRKDLTELVIKLLQTPNVASKEWVTRQYDHEVQAASVMKPFCGVNNAAPTDACVVMPRPDSYRACVVSCGLRPRYGLIDPYWMAASAIDEALRNCVAVGADIERIALLDNFCWGSPDRPDQLAGLVRAAEACYDMGMRFRVPFISGKDSLYNEFQPESGDARPIPPTLLISAVGIIEDCRNTVTPDLKQPGSLLYLVGQTYPELGGSEYFRINQGLGRDVPKVEPGPARKAMVALGRAIRSGLVLSCHDLSEGGLGVALAEMCFGGGYGASVFLRKVPGAERFRRDDFLLFSESNSRFLCEVPPDRRIEFERLMGRTRYAAIGRVVESRTLTITGLNRVQVVTLDIGEAEAAWRRALTRRL